MKNRRFVMGTAAAVVLAAGLLTAVAMLQGGATPVLAQAGGATPTATLAQDAGAKPTATVAQDASAGPTTDSDAQQHQKLVTTAQGLGIDTNGLSDDQIMAAIEAKDPTVTAEQSCTDSPEQLHQKLVTGAGEMGININGLSDDQIMAAIKATQAAATPVPDAKPTQDSGAGPTPDIAAQRHEKLAKGAAELGINISGMSDDQIMAALEAKDSSVQPEQSCSANMQQQHQKLVATAQEMGIDITGMSDDQIAAAIKTKAAESQGGEQK